MGDEIRSNVVNEVINHSWVVEVDEKLKNMPSTDPEEELLPDTKSKKCCIYKLPVTVREKQRDSYVPRVVSFGPYYHDHESCVRTQKMKESVLLYSLKESKKETVEDYLKALHEVVQDLKDAYDELDSRWQQDNDAFLKLMVYDGCFILEILRESRKLRVAHSSGSSYALVNPVYNMEISSKELMEDYRHDLLLLENQLPILVLEKLVVVQTGKSTKEAKRYLRQQILEFIFPHVTAEIPWSSRYLHALDLCRDSLRFKDFEFIVKIWRHITIIFSIYCLCCLPISLLGCILYPIFKLLRCLYKFLRNLFKTPTHTDVHFNIPSATDLKNVGIGFSTSKSTNLMHISVGQRRLKLPEIYVDGATKTLFHNIIAFEQLHSYGGKDVTSYVYFMRNLVQGADDVKILKLRGIIHTDLSHKEVAELFNNTAKDILLDPKIFLVQKYVNVVGKTKECFNKMSDEWQRDLWQNYLRSPCAIISLIAAFLLFALTALQTVYTILGYYNPK